MIKTILNKIFGEKHIFEPKRVRSWAYSMDMWGNPPSHTVYYECKSCELTKEVNISGEFNKVLSIGDFEIIEERVKN